MIFGKEKFSIRRIKKSVNKNWSKNKSDLLCENLTVAEKQLVEIAKALVRDAKIFGYGRTKCCFN